MTLDEANDVPDGEVETAAPVKRTRSSFWSLIKVAAVIAAASAVLFFIQRNTDSEVRSFAFAPEFEFTSYDGQSIKLKDYRGKGVVLNFWASWCGPCEAEAPMLANVWQDERGGDIVFIGLTSSDTEQGALGFMERYGLDYANGPDVGKIWSRRYSVQGIPSTFFIDADGILVSAHRGMLFSEDDLREQIEKIRP